MARSTKPLPRSHSTTTTTITTTITTITTIFTLLITTSRAILPDPAQGEDVPQGCSLHLQEKLVSCRGVNTSLLQDFLLEIITPTSLSNTTITTTSPDTIITTPHPHNTTESKDVVNNTKNNISGTQSPGSTRVTELQCVGCRVPGLTPTLFGSLTIPVALERLSIVNSGLGEILLDALASHALSLVHLDLSYNILQSVPKEVVRLTRLKILDLRHNEIHRVVEGTLLSPMRGLRYLYLDHNQLGQTVSSSLGQGSHRSVFDLWAAEDTPSLPRLSHLGLSFNDIKEIPTGAFSHLSNLLHLDLSHNLLTSLHQTDLPASILNLDLAGNPWNCTCEAAWISERHNGTLPSSITISYPSCFSPLQLHHRLLDTLTASEVCPPEEDSSGDQKDEVVYIGDDVQGPLREAFKAVRLLNATSLTTHALLISWRVDAAFYSLNTPRSQPLSWAVTVRAVTQDPRQAHVTRLRLERYTREQPHWTPGSGLFAEVLEGLDADTAYVICLTVMQSHRLYTRPSHCLHSTTLSTPRRPVSVSPAATKPEALQSYSTHDYDIRTEAFTVWSEPHRASLSWNVTILPRESRARALVSHKNLPLRPLGWRVSYRRADNQQQDEEMDVVLVSQGGEPLQNFTNSYSIEGLKAGTKYVFCLHTLADEELKEALAKSKGDKPQQDTSPLQPISSLTWEAHSHILPADARGRSVIDSRGGAGHQDLHTNSDALPALLPPTSHNKVAPPTHTTLPPPRSEPPLTNIQTFSPQLPSTSSSSTYPPAPYNFPPAPHNIPAGPHNIPPVPSSFPPAPSSIPPAPPSLPSLSNSRPPRPPRPQSGGGFVYTSSGKRIPLPSGPPGLLPPFSVPPPIPVRDPGLRRGVPSPSPPASQSPSRQRFIYEFQETSPELPPSPPPLPVSSGSKTQLYTYQTRRRRRAVEGRRLSPIKTIPLCRQVVTPVELDVVLPATIAATISCAVTVVVVLLVCCCCWPRRCCRRKSAWRSRSAHDLRKISTISSPSPVTVLSGHTSMMAGMGRSDGDATSSRGEVSASSDRAGRSVSTTSSSGYLTPLQSPDSRDPKSQNLDPKAAYHSLMQSRLLQRHKDLPEFHPGYDIPPTASNKTLVGYDYPHPTPVGSTYGRSRTSTTSPPHLPSPSSSDSNYNVSIGNTSESDRRPGEMNLNIPSHHLKSSGLTKSVPIPPRPTDNSNYIYTGEDVPAPTAVRTYLKHTPPSKARHRKFSQAQQGSQEHHSAPHSLSRSTPDLVTATAATGSPPPLSQPASLPPVESSGYINFPVVKRDGELYEQQRQPVNGNSSSSNKEREPFHTWAGHTGKPRPGVGEVVLSGGTLIEVPEGYVVPNAPKPTPFIRLLVRGQDEPQDSALKTPPLSPPVHQESESEGGMSAQGTSVTHLLASKTDTNRLVINT